jgi:hypothetical protein
MKVDFLDEPELEFFGARHIDIRFGLTNYGPLDLDLPSAPRKIRVGIIGSRQSIEGARTWFERCRGPIEPKPSKQPNLFAGFPGFNSETAFQSTLELEDVLCRDISQKTVQMLAAKPRRAAIEDAVSAFVDEIRFLAEYQKPQVIVCALPLEMLAAIARPETPGDDSAASGDGVDFHDLLKARAMRWRLPIQLVLPSTFDESLQSKQTRAGLKRQLQDESTRAWNIHCALYYKAGGLPWQLRREKSDLETCFVGISFYRTVDRASVHTSVAQVFNQRGEGVVIRGATAIISKEDRQPHLTMADMQALVADAMARYRDVHRHPPARLVVHKSSRFNDAECDGCVAAVSDAKLDLFDLVSLSFEGRARLFREGVYPPLRGTMLALDDTHTMLYTRGSVPFFETYPGLYVPVPLLVRSELTQETPRALASEILALTKMNWNNTQFDGGEPVTLRAAKQVKDVLRFCDAATVVEPHYSFYM